MPQFRKKPVAIEAFQWNPEADPTTLPDWLMNHIGLRPDKFDEETGVFTIATLEGDVRANPGDWIIQGVKGELYPCRADIFEQTYEPV